MNEIIKKAFENINQSRVVSLAQELIKIPSENPPGNEAPVAEQIYEKLVEIGFDTKKVEAVKGRPNIIGTLKGAIGKPKLLLCGHSDVVPAGEGWSLNPYGAEVFNGKLYGRGAADMKGGLAAMIEAANAVQLARIELKGDLILAVTVDEEAGGGMGMRYLVNNSMINSDMAVVCEPSDFKLVLAEEGVLWLEIATLGKTAHTLFSEKGVNAIEKMCRLIIELNGFRSKFRELRHEFIGTPILNIGTISGGSKTNMVPDLCKITVDIRLIPGQEIQEVILEIEKLINKIKDEDSSFEAKITPILSLESFEAPKDSEIVRLIKLATKEVTGIEPDFWRRSTPQEDSDMLWLVKYAGIPSVYFGPGMMSQAHAVNEYVEVKDLMNAAKIYAHIIIDSLYGA